MACQLLYLKTVRSVTMDTMTELGKLLRGKAGNASSSRQTHDTTVGKLAQTRVLHPHGFCIRA